MVLCLRVLANWLRLSLDRLQTVGWMPILSPMILNEAIGRTIYLAW
jgi:hypothetical protein